MTTGFLFDVDACTGCRACEIACTIENDLPWGRSWRRVSTFNPRRRADLPVFHLSLACNHCTAAPCVEQCPALAITREPVTGAVLIGADRCIGCGYCSWACPYDAPVYDADAGVMTKCTFCHHRLADGREPACVSGCPTGALSCGELDELPGSEQVEGFPVRDHGASIRFVPSRQERTGPERSLQGVRHAASVTKAGPVSKIRLRTEWPLLVFSVMAIALVAWLTACVARDAWLSPTLFVVLAATAAGASTLHLGRKRRAWRALHNVRRSWLSGEIATYTAFAGLGALYLVLLPGVAALGWLAAGVGFAALFCIDRVYDVAERQGLARLHSADAVPSGALLTSAAVAPVWVTAAIAGFVLVLYSWRKLAVSRAGIAVRPLWTALRVAGLLAPGLLCALAPPGWETWSIALLGAGVFLDRCELYVELEVPSPRRQIAKLAATVRRS